MLFGRCIGKNVDSRFHFKVSLKALHKIMISKEIASGNVLHCKLLSRLWLHIRRHWPSTPRKACGKESYVHQFMLGYPSFIMYLLYLYRCISTCTCLIMVPPVFSFVWTCANTNHHSLFRQEVFLLSIAIVITTSKEFVIVYLLL